MTGIRLAMALFISVKNFYIVKKFSVKKGFFLFYAHIL